MKCFFVICGILLLLSCNGNEDNSSSYIRYTFKLVSDSCVYESGKHCAFTTLIDYKGDRLLAFREANGHRPNDEKEYGKITILKEKCNSWEQVAQLQDIEKDLRDPFFIEINGLLRMYCGYNSFVNGKYQHSGTVYSDLINNKWTEFLPINHDVSHVIWLWKVRKHIDCYYGIGYLEGEKPVLLKSDDGLCWNTVCEFDIDEILSEADMCFIQNTMYICIRQDVPVGSLSWWGISQYPFVDFKWEKMSASIASPEMMSFADSKQILLAGREYRLGREAVADSINVSFFEVGVNGNVFKIDELKTGQLGDKGYPSFLLKNDTLYMSYYSGDILTRVRIASVAITKEYR